MERNLVCSECGGVMQEGYNPHHSHGAFSMPMVQTYWVEGAVEMGFWVQKQKVMQYTLYQHINVKNAVF